MSYKTILVHLNDERRARQLLEFAVDVARAFEAHLTGLHVFPAFHLTPPVRLPIGGEILGGIRAQIREETDRIRAIFEGMTAHQPIVAEWRSATSERREAALVVLEHARAADLVVASQTDPEWDLHRILDFPERLAIEGGRPVVVVPNNGRSTALPKRITVGWNGRREAARAVFDALPLLKRAEQVEVLTVARRDSRADSLPDTEIASALARHGVKVNISNSDPGERTVGEEICARAREQGTDMLVMGAYGHSRFRELVFGGVTRYLSREMAVPVLFSH
jgi:nucleotide-binding universal stress UspA family protein